VLGCSTETGPLAVDKRADVIVVEGLEDAAPQLARTYVGGTAVS